MTATTVFSAGSIAPPAGPGHNAALSDDDLLSLYGTCLRIRRFEERTVELFEEGVVKGTAHTCVGQEAISAGICLPLRRSDAIGSYHRGHGHCIAKGARLDMMFAELMGRDTGYCRGLGGSMHIADVDLNILGANGIVGAALPLAVGAALAARLRGSNDVAVAFFGDGANNNGLFHESLNMAAIWKLPVIFVCENNQWALTSSFGRMTAVPEVAQRAAAYGIPGHRVDGNDAVAVAQAGEAAVDRARAGDGPSLIEAMTWRWGQHSARTNLPDPREEEAMERWREYDPLVLLETRIAAQVADGAAVLHRIRRSIEREIANAEAFARNSAEPRLDSLLPATLAPFPVAEEPTDPGTRELTFSQALNEALHQEMAADDHVIALGEDIGYSQGLFEVTAGLLEAFGSERVRDTPISEAAIAGTGVGAAIVGLRPVVEVQIFDFVTQMMDMIVNQAAKFRFMNGGRARVPVVFRGPQGGGIRLAAQHSQSLETWFAHIPGLVVVAPATAYDAKGLLISAIRNDNPVVFLEHKLLYHGEQGAVPEAPYAIPIGKGVIRRPGNDVTILATQTMVAKALAAARKLAREGIEAEVIDPRTIRPLDTEIILSSVRRTNRLVIVHEACTTHGFGAEVAAMVMEKAFDWLDAPVIRLGAMDVPVPFNHNLETAILPDRDDILRAVRSLF